MNISPEHLKSFLPLLTGVAGSARLACVQVTVEYEEGEGL